MPLDLRKVHEYQKIEGTTEFQLMKVHPTASLRREPEPAIWIQDGGIYYESGEPVKNPPEWFWEDCRQMTPQRRQQLGIRLPEEPAFPPAATAKAPVAPTVHRSKSKPQAKTGDKSCPHCGKQGLKSVGAHVRLAHPGKE